MHTVRGWSPERDAALTQLWADRNLSAAEIGRRLGITKNSVVGRSHRLRLPARQSPVMRKPDTRETKRPNPEVSRPPPLKELVVQFVPAVTLPLRPTAMPEPKTVRHPCSWPIGNPGTPGFAFCGAAAKPGRPYCEEHCQRAYVRRLSCA